MVTTLLKPSWRFARQTKPSAIIFIEHSFVFLIFWNYIFALLEGQLLPSSFQTEACEYGKESTMGSRCIVGRDCLSHILRCQGKDYRVERMKNDGCIWAKALYKCWCKSLSALLMAQASFLPALPDFIAQVLLKLSKNCWFLLLMPQWTGLNCGWDF